MGRTAKAAVKHEDFDTKINNALKDLHRTVKTTKERKTKADECLLAIGGFQDKVSGEKKLSNYQQSKLKTLYGNGLKELQSEADLLRKCLAKIADIRRLRTDKRVTARRMSHNGTPSGGSASGGAASSLETRKPLRRGTLMVMLQQQANTLPLFVGRLGEAAPPLCGAMPPADDADHVCRVGDAVAALVQGERDQEPNWILAEVVSSSAGSAGEQAEDGSGATSTKQQRRHHYEVEDVDEEQKERHHLAHTRVIPLPLMRANADTDPEALFPIDAVVLALYPQTTCFYKGVVEQFRLCVWVPIAPTDDYLVAFEDSSYPSNYSPPLPVPQRYVVCYRHAVI